MTMRRWYVIQTYPSSEAQVQKRLRQEVEVMGLGEYFGEIMVPTEKVVGIYSGKKRDTDRKFFPGYVLVNMEMNDYTWHLVRGVPRVLGFIGGTSDRPTPISDKEADNILQRIREGVDNPKPKVLFEAGEVIRVTEGPFADFNGVVEEVNYDKHRMRVAVLIFGRSTPVDLDFSQVEKG